MMTEPTLDRLRHLRLSAMADAYLTHHQDTAMSSLSFDERFSMLVDAEHLYRDNRALGAPPEGSEAAHAAGLSRRSRLHAATGPRPRARPATRDVSLDRRAPATS